MTSDVSFKPRINWMRSQKIDYDIWNQKFKNYLVFHLASLELEEDFKQHKIKLALTLSRKELLERKLYLVFTEVMRRPCRCTKQWQNVAQVLLGNRIKGRDPFNQNFRKFRSKTQWIGSVQPEKFRKNGSTF